MWDSNTFQSGGHDLSLKSSFSHMTRDGAVGGFQVPPVTFSTAGDTGFSSASVCKGLTWALTGLPGDN